MDGDVDSDYRRHSGNFLANLDITFRNGAVAKAGGFKGWVGRNRSVGCNAGYITDGTERDRHRFHGYWRAPDVRDDVYAGCISCGGPSTQRATPSRLASRWITSGSPSSWHGS